MITISQMARQSKNQCKRVLIVAAVKPLANASYLFKRIFIDSHQDFGRKPKRDYVCQPAQKRRVLA
ncbi:hypothetical protein CEK71_16040 [Methylovulum psychrotolerans]|uniref:Uncharacterized protein n=1 Tax=Methylovulum psychrotolerans TaxID=1704499 RepID=A0A1Z4C1Q9_9GAMM|nr:hypothetical protein CEK71_16040 [Methylovulum psychrotolerans]